LRLDASGALLRPAQFGDDGDLITRTGTSHRRRDVR